MVDTLDNTIAVLSDLPRDVVQAVVDRVTGAENASTWSIRNKYYAADVQFRIAASKEEARGAPSVILVVDGQRGVQSIDSSLLRYLAENDNLDVPLVVGLHFGSKLTLDDYEAMSNGALTEGFEYIALDAETTDEDVAGIDRLREALQTHVWPAATSKPASLPAISDSFDDDFAPFQAAATPAVDFNSDIDLVLRQLQGLRAHAEQITDRNERLRFAEHVALNFASHFDDDELDDVEVLRVQEDEQHR